MSRHEKLDQANQQNRKFPSIQPEDSFSRRIMLEPKDPLFCTTQFVIFATPALSIRIASSLA